MIEAFCGGCGRSLRVDDKYAGKRVKCPDCGQAITIGTAAQAGGERPLIKFRCSHCGQKIGLPTACAGKTVACAKCKSKVVVPTAAAGAQEKIRFACEGCGKGYAVPAAYAGKTTKCKGCGQAMVVPAAAVEDDAGAAGGEAWVSDLLSMEAAAPHVEDEMRLAPVEPVSRGDEAAEHGAAMVARGGYGEGRSSGGGFVLRGLPLGIVGGATGAVIGMGIWAVVAVVSGFEVGWIACGVGALAGFGMYLGAGYRSSTLGAIATVLALGGILGGKACVVKWQIMPAQELAEMLETELTEDQVKEIAQDPQGVFFAACMALEERGEMDEETLASVYEAFDEEGGFEGTAPAVAEAGRKAAELANGWNESERLENVRVQIERFRLETMETMKNEDITFWAGYKQMFGPMDILFFVLALGAAYKIAAGTGD